MIERKNVFGVKDGDLIPNYRALCSLLKIPILSGNSKVAQEKELKRYMDFVKDGHKYLIKKVYNEPLPDMSAQGSLYYELLEFVLCKILSNHIEMNGNLLYCATINELAESVGFVNELYFSYLWHRNKLSAQLNVPIDVVEQLYKESQRNYKSVLFRTLDKMEKQKIIKFQEVFYVQEILEKNTVIVKSDKDRYGDEKIDIYRPVDITDEFRRASQKEIQVIADIEYQTLTEFDAENIYELYNAGKAVEYYNMVQQKLINKIGVGRYYKVIEIYLVKDGIVKREQKLSEAIRELNETFFDKLTSGKTDSYKTVADKVIKLS